MPPVSTPPMSISADRPAMPSPAGTSGESSGASLRALTLPSFVDNIIRQTGSIKQQGVFFAPISGDRAFPTCATRDVAAVAAKPLLDSSWSGQQDAPVLGPEDLSCNDMAVAKNEGLDNGELRTPQSSTPSSFRQRAVEVLKPAVLG